MERDYYVFYGRQLNSALGAARGGNVSKAVQGLAGVDPHLAYLWLTAKSGGAGELQAEANKVRDAWQGTLSGGIEAATRQAKVFHLAPDAEDWAAASMPHLSFFLQIHFELEKPYISKDESDFYLLDNPLRKEKIFKVPMVAATTWKGALRAALWRVAQEDREAVTRLLGSPRGTEEGQAGRLHCYPTFFDKASFEVINPHSRDTGAGQVPVLIECVPAEACGELLFLYVPFASTPYSEQECRAEVARDLEVLANGIQAMLVTYGFGAKTSSGFGTAKDKLKDPGTLAARAALGEPTEPVIPNSGEPLSPDLPRYLESSTRLHPDLRRPDGRLKSEAEYHATLEGRREEYTKKDRQLYEKARRWWEREGRQLLDTAPQAPARDASLPRREGPPLSKMQFDSLTELNELARRIAPQLRRGGGEA